MYRSTVLENDGPTYVRFNGHLPGDLGLGGSLKFSSAVCYGRKPLVYSFFMGRMSYLSPNLQ